jgi:hypothetical protein
VDYLNKPWSVLEPYLDNMSNGTMAYESSLIAEGFSNFKRREALDQLKKSRVHFKSALELYHNGQVETACIQLARASAFWTHATWQEFLEADVIKANVPGAYRPVDDES